MLSIHALALRAKIIVVVTVAPGCLRFEGFFFRDTQYGDSSLTPKSVVKR
jgi:hypothetical protein